MLGLELPTTSELANRAAELEKELALELPFLHTYSRVSRLKMKVKVLGLEKQTGTQSELG